jgi:hypothetical protein
VWESRLLSLPAIELEAVFVWRSVGGRLQTYEDSRRCLLGVEALLEILQKYAVGSWWLLCDEALVERSQQLKSTARPSKAGLALEKRERGAFSTRAAFILTRVRPDTSRTSVLNAVTEPTSRSRVSKVRDSLLPRSASPRPLPDALFHKTKAHRHSGMWRPSPTDQ